VEVQREIVAEIEGYQKEIENYELQIKECKSRIAAAVGKIWGDNETK